MIDSKAICSIGLLFLVAIFPTRMANSGTIQEAANARLILTASAIPPKWSDENWAFNVTFRGVGPTDVTLSLGYHLRDGREYPINIFLILSDAHGMSHELRVRGGDIAPGNMANDIVRLKAGGERSIRLGLEELDGWQPFSGNGKWTGTLRPGNYHLHAEFRWTQIQSMPAKPTPEYREIMNLKSDEISFAVK
jgi:hypothetical protein